MCMYTLVSRNATVNVRRCLCWCNQTPLQWVEELHADRCTTSHDTQVCTCQCWHFKSSYVCKSNVFRLPCCAFLPSSPNRPLTLWNCKALLAALLSIEEVWWGRRHTVYCSHIRTPHQRKPLKKTHSLKQFPYCGPMKSLLTTPLLFSPLTLRVWWIISIYTVYT